MMGEVTNRSNDALKSREWGFIFSTIINSEILYF